MKQEAQPTNFDYLKESGTISLKTFYKSGKGVATPVSYAKVNGKLFVTTSPKTYKVKRLKGTSKATIAPCKETGRVTGPELEVIAKIVPDTNEDAAEAVERIYSKPYWRIAFAFRKITFWRSFENRLVIEITV